MSVPESKWFVGQEVVIRDVNERRQYWDDGQPPRGVVTKVGRKLFTVSYGYGESVYRIEDGTKNDPYGHGWVQTPEDFANRELRGELTKRLRDRGLSTVVGGPTLSTDTLEAVLQVIEVMEAP